MVLRPHIGSSTTSAACSLQNDVLTMSHAVMHIISNASVCKSLHAYPGTYTELPNVEKPLSHSSWQQMRVWADAQRGRYVRTR